MTILTQTRGCHQTLLLVLIILLQKINLIVANISNKSLIIENYQILIESIWNTYKINNYYNLLAKATLITVSLAKNLKKHYKLSMWKNCQKMSKFEEFF